MNCINTLTFEIGNIAYCPYYKYTGIITYFTQVNGQSLIILKNPNIKNECATKTCIISSNENFPFYLQMVCKKDLVNDYIKENALRIL